MTGILLLSRDEFYADINGDVSWGPESDKLWVREFIKDKVVFVGEATWQTIQKYPLLLAYPIKWVRGEPTKECEVHFGGPKTFKKYPPNKMIIHRTRTYLKEGLKFECKCKYKLLSVDELTDYTEIIYVKK